MKLEEFNFYVPERLVAQVPLEDRAASRMMVLFRKTGEVQHLRFLDLPDLLSARDIMVFNRSKVVKARLIGTRDSGGRVEIFLLRRLGERKFECLVKATAKHKVGLTVSFGDELQATIVRSGEDSMIHEVELVAHDGRIDFWIERYGRVPLPPYIHREASGLDISRYQTVYADALGSVAAPTAGLHFTKRTFERLEALGVSLEYVTLHVGLGTFQPIKVEDIDQHQMHEEQFSVPEALRARCALAREKWERVVAVGTTSVRALESAARGIEGSTNLFLKPGSEFRWVDALLTNFHQPKSSLAVMLAAFAGSKEILFEAYAKAVEKDYRFFSYGDCMLVI